VDDPVESWLNSLLCLSCSQSLPRLAGGVPHPSQCSLYYVERDTLFSYHKASEAFLHRMMALYVSSHYKNSPNDLQLMSDAPAHHLFVLLGPQEAEQQRTAGALPDILCVVQVCLEGAISKGSVLSGLGRGERAAGDLIPWCISQQFGSPEFAQLSGARIVRIATHPELQRMGYASRAMELLIQYYEGGMTAISEKQEERQQKQEHTETQPQPAATSEESRLLTETIAPRSALPPLLQSLSDVPPPLLHYIGVSFGLTSSLFSFWSKAGFLPLYLRLTANALTGEHTCIMLRVMNGDEGLGRELEMRAGWLQEFVADFRRRFVHLLAYDFAAFDPALALSVLKEGQLQRDANAAASSSSSSSPSASSALSRWSSFLPSPLSFSDLSLLLTEHDLRRLESYSDNLVDYHLILDLLPVLASLCFTSRLPLAVSCTQQAILLALGLQHKTVETVSKELGLQVQQVLAQFNKTVRRLSSGLRSEVEKGRKQEAAKDKDASRKAAQQERKEKESAQAAAQRTEEEADGEGFGVPQSIEHRKVLIATIGLFDLLMCQVFTVVSSRSTNS
jgi:N-acetyltransferase 10